ncbi:hypothetical protein [Halomontanus rarus]|uniref:hypothetical protein n=1 Tax=Halomontanus rarus TaxID=3034020 RepID=UPI0023E8E33B|nr:hypothetical protein [Halovivax sp. TS33]
MSESERPERRTKTDRTGMVTREAGDVRFVSSPSRTVHERAESDHEEYDYEYHPKCGQRLPAGSLWGSVDADSAEEAVMGYNLTPCTKCIGESRKLETWRMDVFSANVIHNADTPERWQR